ncbi:hypothetical protein Ahy_A08g037942 [Arachis hypogaea]|uniref:Uncharacterized protein n=1 Tax=Arachis hypogaea TaxID=3818 RepID=A0A445BSD8_ARAHY|nr:hypothetical protein Ahy_A08g037942 [Arachis hypogaea]
MDVVSSHLMLSHLIPPRISPVVESSPRLAQQLVSEPMVNRSDSFKGYSRRSIESLPGKSGPGGVSRGVLQRCDGQILICGGGVRGELMLDKHIDSRNPRIEKCDGILDNLVGSLDLPKVEKSPKGKVMMQAMYGVKVQIVFVYSVFAAAFLGSTKKLIDLDVAEIYTWVPEFKSLQNLVNEEVRVRFSSGRFPVLKELEAVDSVIKELYPIILNVVEPIETELDLKTVEQLGRATEKLSKGLDLLAKGVNGFFQVVLSGRDALLSNLRSGGIVYGRGSGGNIGVQAIN